MTYEYIDPEFKGGAEGEQIGLLAQQVEPVFPDWVSEDADGYKMLSVRGLAPLVAEAMRELNGRIAEKDSELRTLREVNARLEAEVARIREIVGGFE